jgi:hypothetical protein
MAKFVTTQIKFADLPQKYQAQLNDFINEKDILVSYYTEARWGNLFSSAQGGYRQYIIMSEEKITMITETYSNGESRPYIISIHEINYTDIGSIEQKEFNRDGGEVITKNIRFINSDKEIESSFGSIAVANEFHRILNEQKEKQRTISQPVNMVDQLEKLVDLHHKQLITDEEYEAAKKRLGL